jgi:ribonucleoside-diphosphate reductase alpha chain
MKQPSLQFEKEKRGNIGTHADSVFAPAKFTAEEKLACSIEAMRNGGECEACH